MQENCLQSARANSWSPGFLIAISPRLRGKITFWRRPKDTKLRALRALRGKKIPPKIQISADL